MWADIITIAGLALTTIGAGVTARTVVLSEDDAISIGVARYAGETREQDLALPGVQNLLKASKGAQQGLWIIAAGTALQLLPLVCRLLS